MNEEYPDYEFYVIRQKMNRPVEGAYIERFNIFRNWLVSENVFKACKKHLRNKKKFTYEELKEEIRKTIMWQEWSRTEYECSVGPAFCDDLKYLKKIDCYWQAEPNIEIITDMCLKRTKEYLKVKKTKDKLKSLLLEDKANMFGDPMYGKSLEDWKKENEVCFL